MVSTPSIQGGSNFTNGRSMSSNSTQELPGQTANTHSCAATSTESNAQMLIRAAGDYSRIGLRVITADATGTATYRLRKDTGGGGANGNNAATLTTATTGWFEDATPHTDTVADGDKIAMAISAASLSVGITYTTNSLKFLPSTGGATYYGVHAPDSVGTYSLFSNAGTARDYNTCVSGGNSLQGPNGENANQRQRVRCPGVVSHANTLLTGSNAVAVNSTFVFRNNGADGNNQATITASSLGRFEDASNSDTINANDVLGFVWRLPIEGTGHNMNGPRDAYVKFVPSVSGHDILASGGTSADSSGSTSAANYYTIFGNITRHTDATKPKTKVPFIVTLGRMRAYVSNSQVGALTMTLQKNGSAANQTFTMTSATTGLFEDATNTDSIADGDDLTYSHGAMVSTFGFCISMLGMTADPGSGITPGNGSEVHHFNTVILG